MITFEYGVVNSIVFVVSVSLVLCQRPHFLVGATTMASISAASSNGNGCPKCGSTKKSGKHSCCGRGGAWFKNCGDAGNSKFGHTWAEGIQTCRGFGTPAPVKTPLRVVLHRMGDIAYSLNTAQPRNIPQRQTVFHLGSMSNIGTTDSEDCVGLARFVVCICVLFVILHQQTS